MFKKIKNMDKAAKGIAIFAVAAFIFGFTAAMPAAHAAGKDSGTGKISATANSSDNGNDAGNGGSNNGNGGADNGNSLSKGAGGDNGANGASSADDCSVTAGDIDAVKAAAAEGLMPELNARRALLSKIINCAKNDASSLQAGLNNLKNVPDNAKSVQSQLSGRLDEAADYYNTEDSKLNGAGVAGTEAVAGEVLGWRDSNYAPLAGNVSNFELWVRNQPLFTAAENRLSGIENVVSYFNQAGTTGDLNSNLGAAQSLMKKASDENSNALGTLSRMTAPSQSLQLIQGSLSSLSDAYQKFFDISTEIQGLLHASSSKQ